MKYIKEVALLTMAAFLFSACGGAVDDGGTPPVVDTTPPNFIEGDPTGSVVAACSVFAVFDVPLLASTITEQSFIIQGSTSATPFTSTDGTWGLSSSSDTIALFVPFVPTSTLVNDTYTVTLTTDISNAAGIKLAAEKTWEFEITDAASVFCPP